MISRDQALRTMAPASRYKYFRQDEIALIFAEMERLVVENTRREKYTRRYRLLVNVLYHTVAGIAALFATGTIIGIPVAFVLGVASAIMGVGALIIGGLALACNNGGYIGIGLGGLVFGCNPVPWYY